MPIDNLSDFDVVPVLPLDMTDLTKPFVCTFDLWIEGACGAEMLRTALYQLVTQKWRLLAARLREDDNEKLYFAIPQRFTDELPPFFFEQVDRSEERARESVPLTRLQISSDSITVHPSVSRVGPFRPPTLSFGDYLSTKTNGNDITTVPPMLSVRIVTYRDATFIEVTIPHFFCDAHGFFLICQAWTKTLKDGNTDKVSELPLFHNPLAALGHDTKVEKPDGWYTNASEEVIAADRDELLRSLIELHDTSKIIHIPKKEIERLCAQTQTEMGEGNKTKLSKNDVLMAWLAKAGLSGAPPKLDTVSASLFFPTDLRFWLRKRYSSWSHIHNAVVATPILQPWTVCDIKASSIGSIAEQVRKAVNSLSANSLESTVGWVLKETEIRPRPFRPGINSVVSTWARLGFETLDFSAALRGVGPEGEGGRLKMILGEVGPKIAARGITVVHQGDGDGGFWLSLTLPETWWREGLWKSLKVNYR